MSLPLKVHSCLTCRQQLLNSFLKQIVFLSMVICGFSFTLLFCLYSLQIAKEKNRGKKDFLLPCITNQISFPTKSFVKIEFGQNICHISLCFVTFSCNCCTGCYYVVFILLLPIIFCYTKFNSWLFCIILSSINSNIFQNSNGLVFPLRSLTTQ